MSRLFVAMVTAATTLTQGASAESDPLAHSSQLIVVKTSDWSAVSGKLQRFERTGPHQAWHAVSEPISIVVGKGGLGWGIGTVATNDPAIRTASDPVKREGDGKAPAGIFRLGSAFGYATEPIQGSKLPYLALAPTTECIDDVASKHYNHIADRSAILPDWKSSEKMLSAGEAYRWGIVVDHNEIVAKPNGPAPSPGSGSCIFLHIWKNASQGTVGCTAMPQIELESLLTWIDPKRNPLLVQLATPEYARLAKRWKLPIGFSGSAH